MCYYVAHNLSNPLICVYSCLAAGVVRPSNTRWAFCVRPALTRMSLKNGKETQFGYFRHVPESMGTSMSLNGFYKVSFGAALPGPGGIVILKDGEITGSDNQFLFSGTYSTSSNRLSGQITVAAYEEGATTVFGRPADKFTLRLDGEYHQGGFSLLAPSPFGGQPAGVIGQRLNGLDLNG